MCHALFLPLPSRSWYSPLSPFVATLSAPSSPISKSLQVSRSYLTGRDGDRINAALAAAGYNFSLLLRWFEELLRVLSLILWHALLAAPLHLTRCRKTLFTADELGARALPSRGALACLRAVSSSRSHLMSRLVLRHQTILGIDDLAFPIHSEAF